MHTMPAHALGLVSLSVSPDGRHALYNGIDGTTFLWGLEGGAVIGKHESFTRPGAEPCESCIKSIVSNLRVVTQYLPLFS
jgi:WD repeat-containing protein 61